MTDGLKLCVVYDFGAAAPSDICRSLGGDAELHIVLADTAHASSCRDLFARYGAVLDLADGIDSVIQGLRGRALSGLVTYSEHMLTVAERLRRELNLPCMPERAVICLTEKDAQRESLRDAGVSSVRSAVLGVSSDWPDALRHVGLPAVLKPVRGYASRDTYMVESSATGESLVRQLFDTPTESDREPFVLETYIRGIGAAGVSDHVSVELAASAEAVEVLAVTGKLRMAEPFRETGQFVTAHMEDQSADRIAALAVEAVRACRFALGVAHVEIKMSQPKDEVIEVNGRLGGNQADLFRRRAALDVVRLAALLSTGMSISEARRRSALGTDPTTHRGDDGAIHYQQYALAPVGACVLDRVEGAEMALQVPGIIGYRRFVRDGHALAGGTASTMIDMLTGRAAGTAEMLAAIDAARSRMRYTFLAAGRTVAVDGRRTPDLVL